MIKENKGYEKEDDQRFCLVSVGILLTKFIADTLHNLFLIDLVIWETAHSYTIAINIEGQRNIRHVLSLSHNEEGRNDVKNVKIKMGQHTMYSNSQFVSEFHSQFQPSPHVGVGFV